MPRKNSPLFSIIVPAYNVEDYLPQCIESVLSQNFHDYELILVDDGSTDRTGKICDQTQKNPNFYPQPSIISQNPQKVNTKTASPPIKVIHQPNSGLSAARNTGVAAASGEYLLFLDGDDYLEPNALKNVKSHLEPNLDLLRFQAQDIFADGKITKYPETGFSTASGVNAFPKLSRYHYIENAWLYAYRRDFFTAHHFQYAVGRLCEDFGLTPLIIASAKTLKSTPDICYNYRQRPGSIMHDTAKIERRIDDKLFQLHQILPQIAAIPHSAPISHFLVVSFLTSATSLTPAKFLATYHSAKASGLLHYIHPSSLKSLPRAFILKHFPKLFYRLYRRQPQL